MALEKTTVEDKIEIVGEFKTIQVRTATVISEDGVELSRSFHRHSINPTDDISNESAEVQAIAAAVHTQAVKDAYTAYLTSTQPLEGE
jgi:hypothetical protein